jgi:hypothetical protein
MFTEPRMGDSKHSRANIRKTREKLAYEPQVGFQEGPEKKVEQTV